MGSSLLYSSSVYIPGLYFPPLFTPLTSHLLDFSLYWFLLPPDISFPYRSSFYPTLWLGVPFIFKQGIESRHMVRSLICISNKQPVLTVGKNEVSQEAMVAYNCHAFGLLIITEMVRRFYIARLALIVSD